MIERVYADAILVTDEWFVPHFAPRSDRPLEMSMVSTWKEYMSWENEHGDGWCSRIAHVLSFIPRALHKRSARVAVTFALWLMTNNGHAFLSTLFNDQKRVGGFSFSGRVAVQSWAAENQLCSMVRNTLEILLSDASGKPVYQNNPFPTLEDNRVVEMVVIFMVTDEGKNFLRKVYKKASLGQSKDTVRPLPF